MEIVSASPHGLDVDDTITFDSTGTLPGGLERDKTYYVVGYPSLPTCYDLISCNTFFVSEDQNGTPIQIDYSDPGTGDHSWQPWPLPVTRYVDILDDLDDTLGDIENKRRVIIEINYE